MCVLLPDKRAGPVTIHEDIKMEKPAKTIILNNKVFICLFVFTFFSNPRLLYVRAFPPKILCYPQLTGAMFLIYTFLLIRGGLQNIPVYTVIPHLVAALPALAGECMF
jgi:hypothetical protein